MPKISEEFVKTVLSALLLQWYHAGGANMTDWPT